MSNQFFADNVEVFLCFFLKYYTCTCIYGFRYFFPRISFFFEEIQLPYQSYLFVPFAQEINLHIILQQLTVMSRSRDARVLRCPDSPMENFNKSKH